MTFEFLGMQIVITIMRIFQIFFMKLIASDIK